MTELERETTVGVIGAGTMGRGIAQVAAQHGHPVVLVDSDAGALAAARGSLEKILARQVGKGRMTREEMDGLLARITFVERLDGLADAGLVIEAVVEDLSVKKELFRELESLVSHRCLLATNTSSLPVVAIASACETPGRCIGAHFFNPAPLMPLVEIVPGLTTDRDVISRSKALVESWGKTAVVARDTPGFIVNRIARPFYGEALRLLEESVADAATIDWAMKEQGGFRMGPFELMDLIGNDVNYKVTETVFAAFYYDPRYRPSVVQQRMVEAGLLGRKTGRGYYDYGPGARPPEPAKDERVGRRIVERVVAMLINEAVDAVFWRVASPRDIDVAMTKGVSYPKGLLVWANEIGLDEVLATLETLQGEFGEDRYRPSPLLRRMAARGETFAL